MSRAGARRYHLELEPEDHEELKAFAASKKRPIREVILECLRACEVLSERGGWRPEKARPLQER